MPVQITTSKLYSNETAIDTSPDKFGELYDASPFLHDTKALQEIMANEGYVLIRQLLDPEEVLKARQEILLKFAIIGEIDEEYPLMDAIASQHSFRDQVNIRALSKSIRTGAYYKSLCHHSRIFDFYERLMGGPVKPFSFLWPRLVRPGEGCGVHYDAPYMNRGTEQVYTTWMPIGDVAKHEGALMILEKSHNIEELVNGYGKMDVDKEEGMGWFSTDPARVQKTLNRRWLTTDFKAGDVLFFSIFTMHCALDNHSPVGKCRLSSDSRFQLAAEAMDERWSGEEPEAHGKDKVFFPGLGVWGNKNLQDEWKPIDRLGRMVL